MKISVVCSTQFRASHILEERREQHDHLWTVDVEVAGPLHDGRVVSFPEFKELLNARLSRLEGSFLNQNPILDDDSRRHPTCENLIQFLYRDFKEALVTLNPSPRLVSLRVSVRDLDGEEHGFCKLNLE